MKMKHRDPNHSTPESLAAADEWHAARAEIAEIIERITECGYFSVTPDEHAHAHTRMTEATDNLHIPRRLLVFNPDDWPGRDPKHQFSIDILRRGEQHRQAQDAWCTAHQIGRVPFEALATTKAAQLRQQAQQAAQEAPSDA